MFEVPLYLLLLAIANYRINKCDITKGTNASLSQHHQIGAGMGSGQVLQSISFSKKLSFFVECCKHRAKHTKINNRTAGRYNDRF